MKRARARNGGRNGNGTNGNGKRPLVGQNGNGERPAKRQRTANYQLGTRVGLGNNLANVRPMRNQVLTLGGSDFLTTVTVKANPDVSQRILKVLPISPSAFPGTRITQLSQLYERYRFKRFSIRWVPAVPTTLACQFVLYLDTDPLDDPMVANITPDTLIRQATAHTGSQQWNFHMAKRIALPMRSDDQMYYTGDVKLNPRFSLQAQAYLLQVTNPVNFNGEPVAEDFTAGSLYIDWEVNFQTPQINPAGFTLPTLRTAPVASNIFGIGFEITETTALTLVNTSNWTVTPVAGSTYSLTWATSLTNASNITGTATEIEYELAFRDGDNDEFVPMSQTPDNANLTPVRVKVTIDAGMDRYAIQLFDAVTFVLPKDPKFASQLGRMSLVPRSSNGTLSITGSNSVQVQSGVYSYAPVPV